MRAKELAAMELVSGGHTVRVLAAVLAVLLVVGAAALVVTPWQQSVSGMGVVSARSPEDRVQTVSAPVEGRVLRWHVGEGTRVKKGAALVEIADNDARILERLGGERSAVVERRRAGVERVASHVGRIGRLEESRAVAERAARSRVEMARDRIEQAEQALVGAEERLKVARLNVERQKGLVKSGLTSQRTVELAGQEEVSAAADVRRAGAALNAARNERMALEEDLRKVLADGSAAIEGERASLGTARAEVANAEAELQRMDVRVARQETMMVRAPRDGTVLRLLAQPASEVVKSGAALALFVPESTEPTVELWLAGMDMPLVKAGDKVRLQFNGWPAIQFVGWPSVAVGTFGGVVRLVDAADTKDGKFRVLVGPDAEDDAWPSAKYLRQGVQAKGWVLLQQVKLGWELWRRFNGFPPVIAADEPGAQVKEKK